MALFNLIFVTIFVTIWMTLGMLPWLAASVLSRGTAGLVFLPVCMVLGVAGGMLVPFVGFTGTGGIWLSMLGAVLVPALFMGARHFSLGAVESERRRSAAAVRTEAE